MKTKIVALLFSAFIVLTMSAQEKTRSYFCQQMAGPVSTGPVAMDRQATFIEWYDDNTIKMMDGTVWKYQGRTNGCHVYSFLRTTGMVMPYTQYINAVFSADFSMLQVNYVFGAGMPGIPIRMNSIYRYIGDGREPAYDWIAGRYE